MIVLNVDSAIYGIQKIAFVDVETDVIVPLDLFSMKMSVIVPYHN